MNPDHYFPTIILIEEDKNLVATLEMMIKGILINTNYFLEVAQTAGEVEDLLCRLNPCLALVDLPLNPDKYHPLSQLKERTVPVIALEANSPWDSKEREERAKLLGVDILLPRPFEYEVLETAIKTTLQNNSPISSQKDRRQLPAPPRPERE